MFDFQHWIEVFQRNPGYNDAESYGIFIEPLENPTWQVIGIHHLTGEENRGNHNVFIEVLCKQNDRQGFKAINWTWEGRQPHEPALPVFAGQKSLDELIDLPLNLGMVVSLWVQGSGIGKGFSSNHPDEETGNTIGHHSFFICFQENGGENPDPPEPEPEPEKEVVLSINAEWISKQEVDSDGYIKIRC